MPLESHRIYLSARARVEAVRAIGAQSAAAAAIHQRLCVLYSTQAIAALIADVRAAESRLRGSAGEW